MNISSREDIRKKIVVIEWFCAVRGIDLLYDIGGNEIRLIWNPEESCKWLKKSGLINDFCGSGWDMSVETVTILDDCDHHGEHVQKEFVQQMHWDDFVFSFSFSQHDAIKLVADYEYEKQLRKMYNNALNAAREKYSINPADHGSINLKNLN